MVAGAENGESRSIADEESPDSPKDCGRVEADLKIESLAVVDSSGTAKSSPVRLLMRCKKERAAADPEPVLGVTERSSTDELFAVLREICARLRAIEPDVAVSLARFGSVRVELEVVVGGTPNVCRNDTALAKEPAYKVPTPEPGATLDMVELVLRATSMTREVEGRAVATECSTCARRISRVSAFWRLARAVDWSGVGGVRPNWRRTIEPGVAPMVWATEGWASSERRATNAACREGE